MQDNLLRHQHRSHLHIETQVMLDNLLNINIEVRLLTKSSNAQEPNIRNAQTPFTYSNRQPFTYSNRQPATYATQGRT